MPELIDEDADRVRVEVLLDRRVLADLDAIVRHRRGRTISRSALVREACSWMLSKEAGWLLRHHAQVRERARRAAEDARSSAEREAQRAAAQRDVIDSALDIARRGTCKARTTGRGGSFGRDHKRREDRWP
jgi:metal-responsive CopG/Arc/MetJ family transcriptional regulator